MTFHIPWNIHHRGALFFSKVNSFCKKLCFDNILKRKAVHSLASEGVHFEVELFDGLNLIFIQSNLNEIISFVIFNL